MHTISKEQIEQAIDAVQTGNTEAIRMLQSILDQQECEPMGLLKVWSDGSYSCGAKHYHDEDIPEGDYLIGSANSEPFVPITEDDVTDEMVEEYKYKAHLDCTNRKFNIAVAVNTWGAKK